MVGGSHGSLSCQRAPRVPRTRRKYTEGSDTPVLTLPGSGKAELVPSVTQGSGALIMSWGLGQGRNHHPRRLSHPRPFRKARAGWRLALSFDWYAVSAFSELVLPGPFDGALAVMQGAVFRHLLGTLIFWYPTTPLLYFFSLVFLIPWHTITCYNQWWI
jgi:hypothetical protein